MDPFTRTQGTLLFMLLTVIASWITLPLQGISRTIVALAGVCAVLLLGVRTQDDVMGQAKARDAHLVCAALHNDGAVERAWHDRYLLTPSSMACASPITRVPSRGWSLSALAQQNLKKISG